MNTYEQAPATQMLATHCACCARPLVDAKSVEIGIGPECRRRHGFNLDVPDEARIAANKLVHDIAVDQDGERVHALVGELRALGFAKLADRITHRLAAIRIEIDGEEYLVHTPYSDAGYAAFCALPRNCRRWDKACKAWRVHQTARAQLFAALKRAFAGATASGPKGLFVLTAG
jgi:hypothetical protein